MRELQLKLASFILFFSWAVTVESKCSQDCDLALASYVVWGEDLTFISNLFGTSVDELQRFNTIANKDFIENDTRINVPFSCNCIEGQYPGHNFSYQVKSGDTYTSVQNNYSNLVTVEWLKNTNLYEEFDIPDDGSINVIVNCSCGDKKVSKEYGLFVTHPLSPGENLSSIANDTGLAPDLLQRYNPNSDFSKGSGLVFIPGKDQNGVYPPLNISPGGISSGVIAGISVGGVAGALVLAFCVYAGIYKRKKKAAIKKMDMQASKEFLAELKVLTHVHHLNLVRLIGYCVEGSLFLVYEFIENGNLSQHLRGQGKDPLPWSSRMQIALDSARGLEYIHEHTVPVYIHRDIKSANILIDKNFRAKVADFGLTKLTEFGSASVHTRLVGTFGYMPPEYAQYGEVSPKIDVYAFGVVLYELISAKEAVVKTNESVTESTGLVALFDDALRQPDPREGLRKLVDHWLGDNYPIDSVYKMAQLAKACTKENPQLRPSMRAIVVALMTLSSTTEDWDVGSFYENQDLVNLMSGR
ncbi:hypothetical protein Pint_09817 [Pistacia integerrima]|uniref:Uncharacterized protein n=1 Tax=Pistacia integerrima TaxID=434235 RepID=A0ACC0XK90_9ROSI|nr:hypothetical protein Pint_09817 [Pistacia integerrima]